MADAEAFSDLYREVEEDGIEALAPEKKGGDGKFFDIKKIFKILDSEKLGPLPLVLLLLLLADVEEDEWLIIIALVAIFGI